MAFLGRSGPAQRGHERWWPSVHPAALSWIRVLFSVQESPGAEEGSFCRNRCVSG